MKKSLLVVALFAVASSSFADNQAPVKRNYQAVPAVVESRLNNTNNLKAAGSFHLTDITIVNAIPGPLTIIEPLPEELISYENPAYRNMHIRDDSSNWPTYLKINSPSGVTIMDGEVCHHAIVTAYVLYDGSYKVFVDNTFC